MNYSEKAVETFRFLKLREGRFFTTKELIMLLGYEMEVHDMGKILLEVVDIAEAFGVDGEFAIMRRNETKVVYGFLEKA